jgi:hypothetical protein
MTDTPTPLGYNSFEEWLEENLRRVGHPALKRIVSLLRIDLPPELSSLFEKAAALYNAKGSSDPFGEVRDRANEEQARLFFELLTMGVQEGLRSSLYHLDRYLYLENEVKRLGREFLEAVKPKAPNSLGVSAPALVSEYESFTFLSRATLDRFARFLAFYFKSYDRNLYRLEKTLAHIKTPRALAILDAIDRHREFLDTQISRSKELTGTERDRLAHREYISWTTVNLLHVPDGSMRVIATAPDEPLWDRDAGEVLEDRFMRLTETVRDLVTCFFDAE